MQGYPSFKQLTKCSVVEPALLGQVRVQLGQVQVLLPPALLATKPLPGIGKA